MRIKELLFVTLAVVFLIGSIAFANGYSSTTVEHFMPTDEEVIKAKDVIERHFPDYINNLTVGNGPNFVFKSDKAIFMFNKKDKKLKHVQFIGKESVSKIKNVSKSDALDIAAKFIEKHLPEIDLNRYKCKVDCPGPYTVLFKGVDSKTGVELLNSVLVLVNPETGEVTSLSINDFEPPATTELKINYEQAYKIALEAVDIKDAQLDYSYGPKVLVNATKNKQVIGYGFVFKSGDKKTTQAIFVDGVLAKVEMVDHIQRQ